jgi:hypothetical protein
MEWSVIESLPLARILQELDSGAQPLHCVTGNASYKGGNPVLDVTI